MLPKKKWIPKIPAYGYLNKKSVPRAMNTNLPKTSSKLSKINEKHHSGQMLGQDRPEKHSTKCSIRSGEIPSPRWTSIDKTNDCVMNSERGALVRGSDPPSGHSVHNTAGDTWTAPARRLIQKYLFTGVENRRQRISIPPRWQKRYIFSRLGEERRTPGATSRLLDHRST